MTQECGIVARAIHIMQGGDRGDESGFRVKSSWRKTNNRKRADGKIIEAGTTTAEEARRQPPRSEHAGQRHRSSVVTYCGLAGCRIVGCSTALAPIDFARRKLQVSESRGSASKCVMSRMLLGY